METREPEQTFPCSPLYLMKQYDMNLTGKSSLHSCLFCRTPGRLFSSRNEGLIGIFSKWGRTFIEFSKISEFRESKNHWSMDWDQFKDPLSLTHMWLAGTVVSSRSLTEEVAGSSPFTANSVTTFSINPTLTIYSWYCWVIHDRFTFLKSSG